MFARALLLSVVFVAACSSTNDAGDRSFDAGGDVDAATAADAGTCLSCSSLETYCADTTKDCPPDLGASGYDAWVARRVAAGWHGPSCQSYSQCPEIVMVAFDEGIDCGHEFLFDAATRKLVAITGTCDAYILASCVATGAGVCVPKRCLPNMDDSRTTPAVCPASADASTSD